MTHAAMLLWVAGASHLIHGNVDLHAMAWLLVGSIPGVLLGSNLSIHVPERSLRIAFAVVLFLSGIKVAKVPGADTIVIVGICVAVVGAAAYALRRHLGRPPAPVEER
jgi:hypothetical protein